MFDMLVDGGVLYDLLQDPTSDRQSKKIKVVEEAEFTWLSLHKAGPATMSNIGAIVVAKK